MATVKTHWTEGSIDDFAYRIASDFVVQLEKKIEEAKITQAELAHKFGVSAGRVSQVLNNPGNLTLKNTVRCARALGMKVAVVAYEDGDPENRRGPVNSEIFTACWRRGGAPHDFFELASTAGTVQVGGRGALLPINGLYMSTEQSANGPDWKGLAAPVQQTDSSTLAVH